MRGHSLGAYSSVRHLFPLGGRSWNEIASFLLMLGNNPAKGCGELALFGEGVEGHVEGPQGVFQVGNTHTFCGGLQVVCVEAEEV